VHASGVQGVTLDVGPGTEHHRPKGTVACRARFAGDTLFVPQVRLG
jgi:hypothetical protein